MPDSVTVRAYAKINLHLRVGMRDPATGYHALETIYQTVDLCDTLRCVRAPDLSLSGRLAGAPEGENNLVLRAAEALRAAAGVEAGAQISLSKRIPVAGGLGGGSSDAAAALVGLNLLWGTGLSAARLKNLARRLGADVPFLIEGGAALGTRFGGRLRRLRTPQRPWWVVLIASGEGLSTAAAYAALQEEDKARGITPAASEPSRELRGLGRAWERGAWPQPTINSFERAAFAARPRLRECVDTLRGAGAVTAHLSGSGPTVFGLFDTARGAGTAVRALRAAASERVMIRRLVTRSPEVVRTVP